MFIVTDYRIFYIIIIKVIYKNKKINNQVINIH